jgi:hypothetical protein
MTIAEEDKRVPGGIAAGVAAKPQTQQAEPQILSDDFIGRALKAHFDDIASTPIPDRFLALLAELEAKEQSSGQ